jgi:branched-chain amino acid transport system substrate-binding protein
MADEQVYCAEAGGVEGEQKAGMDAFKDKFKQKFNIDVQLYAPYVYDATLTLVEAMKKADSVDPAKYLPELGKIEYKGVTGTIAFDEKGDIKNGALTLFTYKGGQREQLAVIR